MTPKTLVIASLGSQNANKNLHKLDKVILNGYRHKFYRTNKESIGVKTRDRRKPWKSPSPARPPSRGEDEMAALIREIRARVPKPKQ
jgi:hypothetical protein